MADVSYSIGLYHSDEGYIAFCDCHQCESHNMRTKPSLDREAALKECEELIQGHHGKCVQKLESPRTHYLALKNLSCVLATPTVCGAGLCL